MAKGRIISLTAALMLLSAPAWAEAVGFTSPSGNILCYLRSAPDQRGTEAWDNGTLTCLIFEAEWDLPPDYGDDDPTCGLDETRTLELPATGTGLARWTCHGDVFWPWPLATLGYGSNWSLGRHTCIVEVSGVACENASDHGFSLKRAGFTLK